MTKNLQWREQKNMDKTRCKKSCCWTPFSCGRSYECRCHSTVEVK